MSLLDALLGRTKPKPPRLDQLFSLPGASVTLEAALGFKPMDRAAVAFRPGPGHAFAAASEELQQLLDATGKESKSKFSIEDDRYGYRWVVIEDPDLEDLVGAVHVVNSTLENHGFGPQLLCSVFGWRDPQKDRRLLLVYLYKRGTFYPFAPVAGANERRDNELELTVRGTLSSELSIETDLSRWYPLWGAPID